MAAKSPIILILGAGPNIGQSVAQKFASKGYKVALAARSLEESNSTEEQLIIPSDLSKTDDIVGAFAKVKKVFGIPSVVRCDLHTPDDPFAITLADLSRDTTINVHSAFVAAQQAVLGFSLLSTSAAKTFIYTRNFLNVGIIPKFLSQGIGKSGAAHMVWAASDAYKDRGYKFYYADERKADGSPKYRINGGAHADLYWELAHAEAQGPWMQTFVHGEGYKKFDDLYTPLA
ncbi:uncharacterized protein PGRI_019780 [Penicillium griseofulvum]|uniref:Short-chain dehydrogenase/reductase SDR n=1 Tax=Penicillium patulum TaxID=5078 RepID=A0A135LGQ2_PENPA|nr:uncharacterized protein PGRI_019780 [Penicillium griseofulvum]KXG48108.1 hypothetical protein PGRI_019780 [Penicillium griseofulvum]